MHIETRGILPLAEMARRHPGLKSPVAEYLLAAASVCLDRHHSSPATFRTQHDREPGLCTVGWTPPDAEDLRVWANEIDTTEAGACACVLAAVEMFTGMVAIGRAETGTGADYYVAPAGTIREDFETCYRVEISGLDLGSEARVDARLAAKRRQAMMGKSNVPAMAGVVGFRAGLIRLVTVEGDL